jgi:hypothetical protein
MLPCSANFIILRRSWAPLAQPVACSPAPQARLATANHEDATGKIEWI